MKSPNLFERFFSTQKLQNLSPRITAFVDLVAGCKGRNLFRIFQIFFQRSFLKTSQNLFAHSIPAELSALSLKAGAKINTFILPFQIFWNIFLSLFLYQMHSPLSIKWLEAVFFTRLPTLRNPAECNHRILYIRERVLPSSPIPPPERITIARPRLYPHTKRPDPLRSDHLI